MTFTLLRFVLFSFTMEAFMSLRVGGLTHIVCESCGRRYRLKNVVDDGSSLWLDLVCSSRSCGQCTAMPLSAYRAYTFTDRCADLLQSRCSR